MTRQEKRTFTVIDPSTIAIHVTLTRSQVHMVEEIGSSTYRTGGMSLTSCANDCFSLIKKGVLSTNTPGSHRRGTRYTLTSRGVQIKAVLDRERMARDAARHDERHKEIEAAHEFESWGTNQRALLEVRAVLFKNVKAA